MKFNPSSKSIRVPVQFSGPDRIVTVYLILDTGASITMLDWDLLEYIGFDPASVKDRTKIITGSSTESAPPVTVSKIEALGHTCHDFTVLSHTLPSQTTVDGLLGLNFFTGTNLHIDFSNGIVKVN